jgi:hypothetical protein
MYAILMRDNIAEKTSVLSTLASDESAALVLMLATAETWCVGQEVDLGFTVQEDTREMSVVVTSGTSIVLSLVAQTITSVIGAVELRAFIHKSKSDLH